jgi:hypothetical protein
VARLRPARRQEQEPEAVGAAPAHRAGATAANYPAVTRAVDPRTSRTDAACFWRKGLTGRKDHGKLCALGETEAGHAGERPARDSRPGRRVTAEGSSLDSCALMPAGTPSGYPESLDAWENSGVWGGAPEPRERGDFRRSEVSCRCEAFVHFRANQDSSCI